MFLSSRGQCCSQITRLHETVRSITTKVFKPCHYELKLYYLGLCMHRTSADLFPAGTAELEWQQDDALGVRATEAGLSVPVRRNADEKAACPRMTTGLKKASSDQIKPRPNRTEMDKAGTRTGTSLSYLGQSSPSSGVISVSLCTTTLVTDMSGCCSLASFMAWARAYIQECSARRDHQGETENGEGREGAGMLDCE